MNDDKSYQNSAFRPIEVQGTDSNNAYEHLINDDKVCSLVIGLDNENYDCLKGMGRDNEANKNREVIVQYNENKDYLQLTVGQDNENNDYIQAIGHDNNNNDKLHVINQDSEYKKYIKVISPDKDHDDFLQMIGLNNENDNNLQVVTDQNNENKDYLKLMIGQDNEYYDYLKTISKGMGDKACLQVIGQDNNDKDYMQVIDDCKVDLHETNIGYSELDNHCSLSVSRQNLTILKALWSI